MKTNWNGKRVLILGAARQGLALARWLLLHGAHVTLNDMRSADELRVARESLVEYQIDWVLGGHPLELLDSTDVLCLSGGVPLTLPIVAEAVKRGIPLSNDSQIFMEVAPCKTVGITGSAGKTTTTTLVGNMAKLALKDEGARLKDKSSSITPATSSSSATVLHSSSFIIHPSVYVGGNIGDPLINYVDEMQKDDIAILEISSFQLDQMTISPNIAAILNITPNHLDRHGTMEAYTAAKARILKFQTEDDVAILGYDDKGAWSLKSKVQGKLYAFSSHVLDEDLNGTYLQDGWLNLRDGNMLLPLMSRDNISLRGDHNIANVLAAFAIGHAVGFAPDPMIQAVKGFRGVPHRLEFVRELRGVCWYNDSIASAPERSMAAIRAFDEPIVLLLGGRDKDLPWEELMKLASERVDHVVLFGEAAEKIQKTVNSLGLREQRFTVRHTDHLHEAVLKAAEVAEPGDVVLLSPGGTSFDEFKDFAERGEFFRTWVQELS
ncbi:MAG: UDP-N-acetylmuramoyl-L-alanine--D-glutamate ligase [Anaerolineae bacterium]|nr:UDP-N-acetylmuramoyl-L-alanine--D-glutamate ligase [Anaerolineae bacterium]MCI0610607.1 UDP-N-acetylmuramoyl-L-alanine--D-glutamate ligase [Anaerolineae bacterium]